MEEAIIIDCMYPTNFIENIKNGKPPKFEEFVKDGMVIGIDYLTKKTDDEIKEEVFKNLETLFPPLAIFIDIEETEKDYQQVCEFISRTQKIGGFLFWFFTTNLHFSELFSSKKIRELDERESNFVSFNIGTIKNEEAEKIGFQHKIALISTHKYLLNSPFLEILLKNHQEKINDKLNKKSKSNGEKIRTPLNSTLRHEVLKRDNYKCVECGATNKEGVLEIHHKIPVSRGGTDELENLTTLCKKCNISINNRIYTFETSPGIYKVVR